MIVSGGKYIIRKGKTQYFKHKYGNATPIIIVEDKTDVIWPNGGWGMQQGNPACLLYAMRSAKEGFSFGSEWYGKIGSLGEIVHESELEKIQEEKHG